MYIKIPCEIVFLCTELSPFLHLTWISDTQRSTRITQNPTRSASCSGWKSKGFQLPCLITTGKRDEMVQQKAKHCYLLRSSVTVMCWKLQKKMQLNQGGVRWPPNVTRFKDYWITHEFAGGLLIHFHLDDRRVQNCFGDLAWLGTKDWLLVDPEAGNHFQ